MKKIASIAMAAAVLTACASNSEKTLVAYFSASGVTKAASQTLAEAAKADLHEITPEVLYTDADLDWRDSTSRSTLEMKDKESRPAIKEDNLDMAAYKKVYLGFPIWWYTAPTIINTFIESHDLAGKTVVLFATSGGSNTDKAFTDLTARYPAINFVNGGLLNEVSSETVGELLRK